MTVAWAQAVAEFVEFVHLDVIQLLDEPGLLLPRDVPGPGSLLHVMTQPRLSEIESKLKSCIKVLFYLVKF